MDFYGNKYWGDSDRASRIYLSRKLEPYGLGGSKFIFFVSVCRNPGITQAGITKVTLFDKTVVTRAVAALEQQGLIYRTLDLEDKRVSHLYPTPAGKETFQIADQIVKDWNRRIYEQLSLPGDQVELLLREIAQANRQFLQEEFQMDVIETS